MEDSTILKNMQKVLISSPVQDLKSSKRNPAMMISQVITDLEKLVSLESVTQEYSKIIGSSEAIPVAPGTQKEFIQTFQQLEFVLEMMDRDEEIVSRLTAEFMTEVDRKEESVLQQGDRSVALLRAKQQPLREDRLT